MWRWSVLAAYWRRQDWAQLATEGIERLRAAVEEVEEELEPGYFFPAGGGLG
jgi:hypothetical protein